MHCWGGNESQFWAPRGSIHQKVTWLLGQRHNVNDMLQDIIPRNLQSHGDTSTLTLGVPYPKRSLMSWVVVIPKEGWTGYPSILLLVTRPSFFWYDTDWTKKEMLFFKKVTKVGVIPKERWVRPPAPNLLLVWQQVRTLGTFSWNTAHLSSVNDV